MEQIDLANGWISENTVEELEIEIQALGNIDVKEPGILSRSIFDDIDA